MLIAQITDFHISEPAGKPEMLYRTADHLVAAVAHLNALDPRPDLVFATGDLVDLGTVAEYERVRSLLAPLAIPVHLLAGNHDNRQTLRAVFSDHAYLQADGPFLQYALEDGPLRIIVLDTLIPGRSGGGLCDSRLDWFEARLAEAPDRPTLVFMHHPPLVSGIEVFDEHGYIEDKEKLGAIVARFPNIERIACGHLHRPVTVRWQGTVVSVAPGTAHQYGFDLSAGADLSVVMEPRVVQLHLWSERTGLVSHTSYIGEF